MECSYDLNREITDEELKLFHNMDRNIYARLLLNLDPPESKELVAFWYLLESKAKFKSKFQFMSKILFVDHFDGLVQDSRTFLEFMRTGRVTSPLEFPTLIKLLGGDDLLVYVVMDRVKAKKTMDKFVNDMFKRAFSDIEPIKTLFLTFSRGHPISEQELRLFFHLNFGDCVEAIYMEATAPNTQPLFARVQCKSASDVRRILGDRPDRTFSIRGKDVRIRRFTEKKTSNKTSSTGTDRKRSKDQNLITRGNITRYQIEDETEIPPRS